MVSLRGMNRVNDKAIFFCLFSLVLCLSGCTKLQLLPYLDQALTLQDYSDYQEAQHKFVKETNAHYLDLRTAVTDGSIKNYPDRRTIEKKFGPPILEAKVSKDNGVTEQRCLYRHAKISNVLVLDKIYLYYDQQDRLESWEML